MDELTVALSHSNNGKAMGIDGLPNEVLKLSDIRHLILQIINAIHESASAGMTLPQTLKTSVLVTLFKKGDLSDCGNWRGIALMPHITKLYDKLLLFRLRVIDPFMSPLQNGFREGRNTTHHILALTQLLDIAKTRKNYPLHGCFVDFSKAFDSISWPAIKRALLSWNTPTALINAIFAVMEGHTMRVRVDKELTDPIQVGVGVLQGDTLAPFLFVLVVDGLLSNLPRDCGITVDDVQLVAMAFADDIVLLAPSVRKLQQLFSNLEANALKVGLKINLGAGKTERFKVDALDPDPTIPLVTAAQKVIPLVDSYKYLGVYAMNRDDDWKRRKGMR